MNIYDFKKKAYRNLIGCCSYLSSSKKRDVSPSVFYGGARGGHKGGPQIKVDLLNQYFPQSFFCYNILYILSGALHIPKWAIQKIKIKNIPIVLNQNGVFYPAWSPNIWEEENKRMADAMRFSSYVFYQSEFCKKSADRFLGISAQSYEILYNGVDITKFIPIEKAPKIDVPFNFLITGNISSSTSYRIYDALESLYIARKQGLNAIINFHGFLPDNIMRDIKQKIDVYNLDKFFTLHKPYSREDAPLIFGSADAYIMTKHNDPCPNVVLEAMACGLPVLYVSSGGVPELVGDTAGVCVPVEETYDYNARPNINNIVSAMSKIIANRDDLSDASRARCVQKFDISLWIKRHEDVFYNLLKNKNVG